MEQINAGVVCVTKFVPAVNQKFEKYVDYIDREASRRNDGYGAYNLFEESIDFEGYQDYMGTPEKSGELFTAENDFLEPEQKQQLKEVFHTAQQNESVMWQTVLSFDNKWLDKNGVFDCEHKKLDEQKMRELTRVAMQRLMKSEKLSDTGKWCASIHYNTDNIHVHIAMVEPVPTRPKIKFRGAWSTRGNLSNRPLME